MLDLHPCRRKDRYAVVPFTSKDEYQISHIDPIPGLFIYRFYQYRCSTAALYIEPMIGMSVVDTTDTAFSFTDLATITKYDTIISTAITQSERHMKLDSPLTSTFFFCSAVIVL